VLGHKKIAGSSSDRYRVFISDGIYSNSFSMMATQMNHFIADGKLENFTVIRANNFICNNVNGKKVIILLDIEVIKSGAEVAKKIGEPVQIAADGSVANPPPAAGKANISAKRAADSDLSGNQAKRSPLAAANGPRSSILDPRPVIGGSAFNNSSSSSDLSQSSIFPIASLTPYQNKWTIKARVTNKSDIRRWNNSRGEGHLFSMDLLDSSGEIRATGFKEQCDKFYTMIEVGKVNCSFISMSAPAAESVSHASS
jgi:replication factor A1